MESGRGTSDLSPLQQALLALKELRARLHAVEKTRTEPIAVVGMSCRFPGADGPEAFWGLLREGRAAIREVPPDRWDIDEFYDPDPEVAGKMYTRSGGFIDGVDLFDPQFFGISPREAASMDPQQRLLLETTWQALERAGVAPDRMAGTRAGVFLGISGSEYSLRVFNGIDPAAIDPYFGSGGSASVASGRLSYVLGLQGPSISVDTACSSSLVAVHLACQSLRGGESQLALVGGVGILLVPEATVNFSRARMMAPDGRCKTFDAKADGYVRGEGCGVVVLKRLSDAQRDGNPVLAVIRGSAVNQDGRSGGLTAPNGLAQEAVIRDALASASLKPADVSYVEAHGTGTPLGDPIEVRALMSVMSDGRAPGRPLVLGSAKTNIGHLEAAAGIAGLIKVVLSLQHEEIPAHLHFENPSPHIAWDELPVTVPTALRSWPEGRKIAGVSSFGFSGTNAHVILEEAPKEAVRETNEADRPLHMLSLSGMNEEALVELAGRYRAYLGGPEAAPLGDVCFTANVGRSHFAHRLAVVGGTAVEVAAKLQSFETGQESPGVFRGVLGGRGRPKVVFLFTGQGSQYAGMGRGLYETQPTFRKALDLCAEILKGRLAKPLLEVMFGAAGSEGLVDRTAYTQPSLFALEWALSEMWRSWGVEPGAVLGHSVGEYVAAAVSGVLTLEDALGLIAERGRLMESLPSGGAMVAVAASEEKVKAAIKAVKEVSIAAVNGPSSVVISGAAAAVKEVSEVLLQEGIKSQELVVSHAFHSALLDPMLGALEGAASKVEHKTPRMAFLSNLTGRVLKEGEVTPEYWRRHARETVRFADSMRVLEEKGYEVFVELGPHPVLLGMGRGCVKDGYGSWLPSLRKGKDDWGQLLESVAALYVGGVPLDGVGFDRDYSRRRVVLPTYPFQRQRYWIEGAPERRAAQRGATPSGYREWLCSLEWQPAPAAAVGTTLDPGRWLVCGAESGTGPALVSALRGRGHKAVLATTGGEFASSPAGFVVDPTQAGQVDRLLAEATREGPLAGVVNLWGLEAPEGTDPLEAQRHVSGSALHLAQSLARHADPIRLWLVTRGAQAVGGGAAPNVDQAPLWGLGRTLFVEQPKLHCVCVDLDPEDRGVEGLVDEVVSPPAVENQIALRAGVRYVARLVKSRSLASLTPPALELRPDATYLVTGGLRGLGLEVAKWLVERGARNLALLGRRAPGAAETMAIEALEAQGARVLTFPVDVADLPGLRTVFARLDEAMPSLRGIVHCAGVIDDGLLADQTWERFAAVMAPKLGGAANLDALTRERQLDFFVLFSSASALLGTPGKSGYAAANAWLDALAHQRLGRGLCATAVNWGAWAETGMAVGLENSMRLLMEARGIGMIPTRDGLTALGHLLSAGEIQAAVLPFNWATFVGLHPEPRPPLFAALGAAASEPARPVAAVSGETALIREIAAAAESERPGILFAHVRSHALKVLGLQERHPLNPDQPLSELGLDSLMTVELRNALGAAVGVPLSATLLFEYPTVNALVGHLVTKVALMSDSAPVPLTAERAFAEAGAAIAVIGMGCRFPGGASSPEELWRLLKAGEDATCEVPSERWDIDEFYDPDPDAAGKMYMRRGAFIEDVDLFDPQFFGIAPREAAAMDPQQRLLLEVTWQALERAGVAPESLAATRTGVFVGISGSEYGLLGFKGLDLARISPYSGSGVSTSVASGRLSYVLGLQGPSVSIDTACSSSMVAAYMACQSLRSGQSNLAVVGGVGIMLLPESLINLSRARMLAADGRCKTFDAKADGYSRGEGCGVVVLKRLSDAVRDGDTVLAVIRGSAVNQDGRSGGLTAPNGLAQEAVLREALEDAGVKAADVGYVEAHGTGTPLGDPIEVRALMAVMGEGRGKDRPLLIGSLKTNIGHLEAAAGIAGLIKVVLSLQHEEIPAHLHFENPSPHIAWDELPVTVPTALRSWPEGRKIAGVSSFGFSGTNAHVILEEAPKLTARETNEADRPLHVLSLSGMNEEALLELAGRYRAYLGGPEAAPLGDVCFTANVGRSHFAHRLAVVGGTAVEVAAKLQSFETGQESPGVFRGVLGGRGRPKVAFLFTGQGSQYAGMGRGLYETQPTFRKALDLCAEILKGRLEKPLLEVMFGAAGSEGLVDRTAYTQPSLFALEWALSEMWRSWGVEPGAVLGHSVGEYVAAAVSGVLTLEDALGLIAERGRLMESLPSGGAMVAVAASEEKVKAAIKAVKEVSIAAVNGPSSVVISGAAAAVKEVSEALLQEGIKSQELVVSHAFHSALLDPMLGALEGAASKVEHKTPRMAFLSNLTGRVLKEGEVTPEYWRRHARETVRFADSMRVLEEKGYEVFVELGPHPVLLGMGRGCVKDGYGSWLPSLRKGKDDWGQLLESVAALYVGGVPLDGVGFDRDYSRRRVVLPTYPFQRQRYWIEGAPERRAAQRGATPSGYRDWLCSLEWHPAPRESASPVEPGRFLVCGAESGAASQVVEALRGRGHKAVLATTGGEFASSPAGFVVDPTQAGQVDRLLAEVTREGPLAGVVNLWGLEAPEGTDPLEAQRHVSGSALHLAQSLARQADPIRLWLVTRGAQAVGGGVVRNVDQAPLWGLGRTLFAEQPRLGCVCVDLDPESEGLDGLVGELLVGAGAENQIALRPGVRYVARLVKSGSLASLTPPALELRPDATYLVTGGLRGLGLEVAKWLVERGARNLALLGRRAPGAAETMAIEGLEAQGARVLTFPVDVADLPGLRTVFARLDEAMPSLRGIVHCAGVIDDGLLADQTWERFAAVMAPKLGGAANLDALTRERQLDFFVLFSSASALLGSPGQANYAAANAGMDALAHRRRALGLAATAINWGAWGEVGMAARLDEAHRRRQAEWGSGVVPVQQGLKALGLLIGLEETQAAVLPIDWPTLLERLPEPRPALLAVLAAEESGRGLGSVAVKPAAHGEPALIREIAAVSPSERQGVLLTHVRRHALKVLGLQERHPLNPDQPLSELGLDSLMTVELRNALGAAVGVPLSATLLFEYPTVNALSGHLTTRIPLMRDAAAATKAPSVVQERSEEPIAVIGMSCRFPGATGPEEFWSLLQRGEDATREVPRDRWDIDEFYDPDPEVAGKMYTRRGGFIDGIDLFDPHFFGISPREASSMDPQQRLLLEGTWLALERAGVPPDGLAGTRTGVFVGISGSEWAFRAFKGADPAQINPYSGSGTSASIASGRLSYVLGLQGPCVSVDTACSASMVAAHLACQSLRSGESNLAVVGGVGILLLPEGLINLSRARMVSPDGRCKTFDAKADGYARGEGCGIVILKRLSDAVRDGNPVLAVIRGSAVNQDGRSGGLTAPNGLAQEAVIRDALANASLKPLDVSYVEAHGTGTPLGDPIEVRALMAVLGEGRSRERSLVLGSAKTNIGHLEAAAGIAGLIKVVLSLQHEEIPAHLHFENPSPHIAWDELPVTVPTALRSWPEGRKIAGVSSFGFSGTNAHVILEEAPKLTARETNEADRPLHMLSLSGMNEEALVELAGRYRTYLGGPEAAPLGDVCFTANVGRAHFAHRLAVVGGTAVEVAAKLQSFETGQESPGVFRGVLGGRGRPKVAFLFTGQGSQYAGMGRGLYETQPTFRKALDLCAEILKGRLAKPLLEVMFGAAGSEGLVDRTAYTQPSLFALEWALSEMWRSWGVEPGAVLGHSVGEYVAAAVSGVLTLEDALGLIAERGRLMESLPSGGAMVAVAASEEKVKAAIKAVKEVSIAAVNGPSSVVISGAAAAVKEVSEALLQEGIKSQELVVSHAFHSALLDPMLGALEGAASKVEHKTPRMAFLSNLTGRVLKESEVTPEYWRRHARETVRFADSMRVLEEKGYEVFVELGPHPVLLGMGRGCVKDGYGSWLPSLRKGKDDWGQLLESVAGLYVGGVPLDGVGFDRDYSRRRVVLPTYPFQRQRYWIEEAATPREVRSAGIPTGFREWVCEVEWQPAPAAAMGTTVGPGRWLVCGAESGTGSTLVAALRGRGHKAVLATTGGEFASSPAGFVLDPTRPEHVDRLLAEATREGPLAGVVNLWGLEAPEGTDPLETQRHVSGSALHLAQSLARQADPIRLWLVTRGAQAVGGRAAPNVDQAPLWGLGRTLFVEQPGLRCVCVDLDPEREGMDGLVGELLVGAGAENQIALRAGVRYVARLVKSRAIASPEAPSVELRPDATYLVTGGLRGLGLEVAKWLVERGAHNLALVGRRAPAAPETMAVEALEAQGVRVLTLPVDVADPGALAAAFARVDATLPPLRGVVHCAGVIDDALLADQTWGRFAGVMRPKLEGAANLDALTRERELDFFVLFSSSASLLGSPGQANYAAANAWMDALAHRRRALGLAATAINWGAWGEVGMAARLDEAHRRRQAEWGSGVIPLRDGLDALGLLIGNGNGAAQAAVLRVDWPTLLAHFPEPRPAFLTDLAVLAKAQKAPAKTDGPPTGLDRASPEERRTILEGFVAQQVAKVLALDSTNVPDRDDDFRRYGMDSLMAMDLRNRLQAGLSRSLSAAVALEHSTIGTLAAFLAESSPPVAPSEPAADLRKGVAPSAPPVPGARLGRDATGKEAWFVPDPARPGKYLKVTTP